MTPAPIAVPATSRLGRGALKPWSTDAGGIAEPWLAESSSWPASLRSVLIPEMRNPVIAVFVMQQAGHFYPLAPLIVALVDGGAEVHVFTDSQFKPDLDQCRRKLH